MLSGFRQVYEHAGTNHHKSVLSWVMELKTQNVKLKPTKNDPILTEFYNETSRKKIEKHPCYHIWDKNLVNRFKDNNTIRTKKTTTLFYEKKLWKMCVNLEGHKKCCDYDQWKAKHQTEHRDLCKESESSSRVVFIPGKTTTPVKADGFLKSIDPPCLGFSQSLGLHPYTCENCESRKEYLHDLMNAGIKKAALLAQNWPAGIS
eukprot:TCONS_00038336-protein